ncbi:leucine-rich repeat domain-containing protein [bacterium]|nr:leucine-rich repeat domain-containing protein [bacterium]
MNKRAMREAVEKCVALLGPEILLDSVKFKAAVLDLLPGFVYKQERDWLFISAEIFNLGQSLLEAPPVCRSDVYNSLFEKLKDNGLNDETSDAVLQAFTCALKWNVPSKFPDLGDIIEGSQACRHGDIDFIFRRCRQCGRNLYGIFEAGNYIAYEALNKTERGGVLFSLGDYGGALVLPEHLHGIGDCAFNMHKRLREVVFHSSLTSIGRFAFEGCASLKSVELPDSLCSIGKFAFADCTSLRSAKLPASLKAIENGVFSGCTELDINIPASVTSIADDAFAGVKHITYLGAASGAPWGARNVDAPNAPTPPGGSGGGNKGALTLNSCLILIFINILVFWAAYWATYNVFMHSSRKEPSAPYSASSAASGAQVMQGITARAQDLLLTVRPKSRLTEYWPPPKTATPPPAMKWATDITAASGR